jgi:hypothetical protein
MDLIHGISASPHPRGLRGRIENPNFRYCDLLASVSNETRSADQGREPQVGSDISILERVVKFGTPKMQVTNGTRSVLASGANR